MMKFVCVLCAMFISTAPAFAGLIGSTVNADYNFDSHSVFVDFGSGVVSNGVEFPIVTESGHTFSFDITDSSIIINYLPGNTVIGFTGGVFNGFEFVFTNLTSSISGVTVNSSSSMAYHNVSFNSAEVFVDLGGVFVSPNRQLTIDVGSTNSAVPEPASAYLVLIGFCASLAHGRRRYHAFKSAAGE
jgi:hypothetical protein